MNCRSPTSRGTGVKTAAICGEVHWAPLLTELQYVGEASRLTDLSASQKGEAFVPTGGQHPQHPFLLFDFFSGGAMCDVTPIGELCETRVAMMKSDTETFTNGHGENQEVT